ALETSESAGGGEGYRLGAENAKKAGCDGVERHGANGYLPGQVPQSATNPREDQYRGRGGDRARLRPAGTGAAIGVWGAGRVGMHLAPRCDSHDVGDSDPLATFTYVARELGKRGIAFLYTREHRNAPAISGAIREAFGGPLIANEGLTPESARQLVEEGNTEAVSFGRLFIANPDLVRRLRENASLNEPNPATFYGPDSAGYTDYPFLS